MTIVESLFLTCFLLIILQVIHMPFIIGVDKIITYCYM